MSLLVGLLSVAALTPPPVAELTLGDNRPDVRRLPVWLGFTPDGTALVARYTVMGLPVPTPADDVLARWAVAGWREQPRATLPAVPWAEFAPGPSAGFAPDGLWLAATADRVWLAAPTVPLKALPATYPTLHAVWANDDGRSGFALVGPWDGLQLDTFPLDTGRSRTLVRLAPAPPNAPAALAVGAGRLVVAADPDGAAGTHPTDVWNVRDGRRLVRLADHGCEVSAVAVSPDGGIVATGGADGSVRLWDAATGRERAVLTGPSFTVIGLAFSANGKRLVYVTTGGKPRPNVWLADPATGNMTARFVNGLVGAVRVAISPDGRLVATSGLGEAVRVWDVGG